MKVVLGIDPGNRWKPAAALLTSLRFPTVEIELVRALEPYEALVSDGEEALKPAAEFFGENVPARQHIRKGDPLNELLEVADDVNADLIAAGSERKGAFGSLYFGSVGRGLVLASRRSILIGKEALTHNSPLTVVLATDHSRYMDRCIERLAQLSPQGIGRLVVVSASGPGEAESVEPGMLADRTAAVCERLDSLIPSCAPRVLDEGPVEAIRAVMTEEGADLLIIGAQGHGFLERLTVGSVALHAVVSAPHNVLILRP